MHLKTFTLWGIFSLLIVGSVFASSDKNKPITIAEKSNFESTSRYDDVINFITQLKKLSSNIRVETIAKTIEGKDIPLLVIGHPLPKSSKEIKNDKRTAVYIQANIHAGEVEGKEAALMFARDVLLETNPKFLDDIILLICPIFNADGNDKISTENRRNQNGPINGVGVRHNGQNLDLNRDAIKAETPEVKGMITNVLNRWDPAVMVDLHTTNGSYHEETITFTWMMNGNTDRSLINYMRDKMMPAISKTLSEKYNTMNCFYGEFVDMRAPEKGWESYAFEPRYIVNYIGLRNRLAILNENYVYAEFKTRVLGCYNLLYSILDYVSANKNEIKNILENADAETIACGMNPTEKDSFAVEFVNKPTPQNISIKAYEVDVIKDQSGRERFTKSDRKRTVTVPYFADYFPKRSVQYPYAYIINVPDPDVIHLLKTHGIKIEKLGKPVTLEVQTIKTKELKPSQRLNQGHYNNTIKVEYVNEKKEFAAGSLIVRTAQPLANVAAYLLEPETDDGLLTWNYWDKYLVPQWGGGFLPYPVSKILAPQTITTSELK